MPAVHERWTVLPHGPVTRVDDAILTVTGEIPMPLVHFERRMTVVGLGDGTSVIYSAIALDAPGMRMVETLGEPRWLIVPGDAHRLDARIFKARYPAIRVIAPEGARARVEKALPVDDTEADFNDPNVLFKAVPGTGGHEASLMVRRASGVTLILNDLIGNLRRKGGFEGWLLHVMGFGGDGPQIPTVERFLMVRNKNLLRRQLVAWANGRQIKRILMSHGAPIEHDLDGVLRRLAQDLR
ncbi:MAG TPA: hypothetical protein VN723_08590 [Rhizomicrobium sp.]|jgi:hypothetical protein|nr:hypothetical protein [Rhizomicrobium sp.]